MTHNIWVFGDHRNYFQNRVTLQLLARSVQLGKKLDTGVAAVVFGHEVQSFTDEYIAHGADQVFVIDHPCLKNYCIETYCSLLEGLVREHKPFIILIGATCFGRELAPKLAKRLKTGLTADCVDLDIDSQGLLVQTAPAFGGRLLAAIITPQQRPQMATVRPGTFKEQPHNYQAAGIVKQVQLPGNLPEVRVRLLASKRLLPRDQRLEDARIVVCGGRGMGSKQKFKKLYELARLMNAEVGATRPVVYSGWVVHDALVGQAGRQIQPQIMLSFGISGALQHTAAFSDIDFIIAVNKNPNAAIMKMADVAIVADANQVCTAMIKNLKAILRI